MGIMNNSDLSYQTALETARLIRTRQISALEVMDATIARVEAANDKLNAFTYTAFDEARDKARQADKLLGKSRSSSARDNQQDNQQVAPLFGVPIAMKDSSSLKPNWPISFGGIPQLKEHIPALSNTTSYFVKKMETAGAIFIGRTNAPIMGFRGTTDNPAFGPTCNPFDLSKNAGGSSGGSAAAVSAGLLPISHATDGGGSIRIPAAWTNCVGYKASAGRIPAITRPNAFNDSAPYVYEGTITRTVEDTLLSLSILSGVHQDDPHSFPFPPISPPNGTNNGLSHKNTNPLLNSIKGMKIGYSPNLDVFPVEKEVAEVVADAVKTLQEAGAEVEEIKIGIKANHNELSDIWCRLVVPSTRSLFNYIKDDAGINLFAKEHRHVLPTELIRWVEEIGATYSADAMYQDLIVRTEVFDAYQETLSKYDLIASPTLSAMPVKNTTDGDTMGPSRINGEEVNPLIGWCPTLLTNFTGHPSISVPAGLGRSGMPVGLHLTGRRGADVQVLSAAAYFEIIRPWKQHYSRIASPG